MHEFQVVDRCSDSGLYALQCNRGRYHVARALRVMPPADATLTGDTPRLGFGLLQCAASGAIFRVIFEAVDEPDPASFFGRAHGPPASSAWPSTAAARASR